MASAETTVAGDDAVELVVCDLPPPEADGCEVSEEITPLLTQAEKPKINIFTLSYPRKPLREQVTKLPETECSHVSQFIWWVWSGSRYSGLLSMAMSSTIYFTMDVVSDTFSAQSIPLFETAFTRCTAILIISYVWLRRTGQPIFGPPHVRSLLFLRALTGLLSMMSFIYCIQRLPLSQAIVLSFTTPIMASIAARFIFHEKLKILDLGALAGSFFGVIFTFRQMLTTQGFAKAGGGGEPFIKESHPMYAVLAGLFSSITGGISYCLTRTGAKASDQPVATVFSFGLLASPATAICTLVFEEFVLPGILTVVLMLILGALAFFAEMFAARGLQLEKTSKVVNIQYMEAALAQLWGIGLLKLAPSFGRLVGCFLIVISVCCTMFFGPDKEIE